MVFLTHFERRFRLPTSTFLEFFGFQPHHLGAGAIVQLFGFVTLCEGYLGVEPTIDLWARFFSLQKKRHIRDILGRTNFFSVIHMTLL